VLTKIQIQQAEIARLLLPLIGAENAKERAANIVAGGPETIAEIVDMIQRGRVSAERHNRRWPKLSVGEVRYVAVGILQVLRG
jgi:hypothetical protein